jgi:predicted Ser/Thr protein kinase
MPDAGVVIVNNGRVPENPARFADRYRLAESLGRGGMGEVWKAYDERLNRDCAVKVLRQVEDAASAERFSREARTLASLRHPGVVTVYDYGVDEGRPYLVMELLPGPSLAELIREQGRLSISDVRRYGSQAALALQAVHEAGVVHRDVKPANLVIDFTGNVRLVDFGIAVGGTQGVEATLTEHGAIIGSAAYLAPEQATGHRADARSDVYGFGCLLMTLLTGKPPFDDDSPVNILGQHLNDPPPRVSERRPEVPADIDRLVDELLSKRPEDRPASAAEAARLLSGGAPARPPRGPVPMPVRGGGGGGGAAGTTVNLPAAPPPGPPSHAGENGDARKVLIAVLVVLALLAGGTVAWALTRDNGTAPEPVPNPFLTSTPKPTPTPRRTATPTPTAALTTNPLPSFTVPAVVPIPTLTIPTATVEPSATPTYEAPEAELSALTDAVDTAVVNETKAPGAKNDLQVRVSNIRAAAEGGLVSKARSQTTDLINKIGELEGTGALDPETAARLKKAAEDVKAAL